MLYDTIETKFDTWLKQSDTRQANDLSSANKYQLRRGDTLEVQRLEFSGNHLKITLVKPLNNIFTWYGYADHFNTFSIEIDDEPGVVLPLDKYPFSINKPNPKVTKYDPDWSNFQDRVSVFFTVGEMLCFDKQRISSDRNVRKNIIALANELDKIRTEFGAPIGVTSGYRPTLVNRRVGGVRNSQHILGNAVDIYPIGGDIYKFQSFLDEFWFGALGWGARRGFVHLDMRNGKGWRTGGSKA